MPVGLSLTARIEHEGIFDGDDAATFGAGEPPMLDRIRHAFFDVCVFECRFLDECFGNRALWRNEPVHHDAAVEPFDFIQFAFIAGAEFTAVLFDDFLNDAFVE